ncbi:MAG: tetratricopeptide repeat protein [Gemmatimonadales bacterium]
MTDRTAPRGADRPAPVIRPAARFLAAGRAHERSGRMDDAVRCYEQAIEAAGPSGERPAEAEALRALGVVRHRQGRAEEARELCRQSHDLALTVGDGILAAEALNALAGFAFEAGSIAAARETYLTALLLGGASPGLRGRIEQNLGILATIQGRAEEALAHYGRSLEAFEQSGDERGAALCYHNLGMVAGDRGDWDAAVGHYRRSLEIALRIGDVHLEGLCRLNRAEILACQQHYGPATEDAESALQVFERLGARLDKSGAYKVLGIVYRDTGRPVLAEARFKAAIDLAVETGYVLGQAEASREMARLHQGLGRNREALTLLNESHRLFSRLDAATDLVDVARKMADLEHSFFAVVRDWGQSIESADTYTHGHCERVAEYAVTVARAIGLDDMQQTTIRLGAYLHDLGKVKVPHEVLNKPGRLTPGEFELMKLHPVYGVEMLQEIDFPWDIKPIIRWHHEKLDGTGYPDRLRGDEIPVSAQIIGIVDVYDALTTTRSYRGAMDHPTALAEMARCRHYWREDVYTAFLASVRDARAALPSSLSVA